MPDTYTLRMDAAAWSDSLIDVEPKHFGLEIALKEALLSGTERDNYVHCPPETEALAWEALELLLTDAASHWPQHFELTQAGDRWIWTNRLQGSPLGGKQTLTLGDQTSLPCPVLEWLGRQFQEDLVLMGRPESKGQKDHRTKELVCLGGCLCFGSGWSLADKLEKPILSIHGEVPGFQETAGKATDGLLHRLKAERPVGRWNWTLSPTSRLNLTPAHASEWMPARQSVTKENAGDKCFVRAERQTLSRLPRTGGVLFTIHTYLTPVHEIAADPVECRRLLSYLQSTPQEIQEYRGMTDYADALISYLTQAAKDSVRV